MVRFEDETRFGRVAHARSESSSRERILFRIDALCVEEDNNRPTCVVSFIKCSTEAGGDFCVDTRDSHV